MDIVLDKYRSQFVNCFINDILVYSNTFEDHLKHLEKVFQALHNARLKINKEKSHFIQEKVTFLGHTISAESNKLDLYSTQKIKNYPRLQTVTLACEFLGLVG